MTSRKKLKKAVKNALDDLSVEAIYKGLSNRNANRNQMDDILVELINIRKDYVSRISHVEPGSVKAFYKNYRESFTNHINEMIDKIEKL